MSLKAAKNILRDPQRSCRAVQVAPTIRRCQSTSPPRPDPSSPTSPANETRLAKILRDSIIATGPLSVSRYMSLCLTHPTAGYYSLSPVFGPRGTGDFITSPEISQVFGELVAIWLLTRYLDAGSPDSVRLVELGPGRGTLMDDVLRTFGMFAQVKGKIRRVLLVENSAKMRAAQKEKLSERARRAGAELEWRDSVFELEPCEAAEEFTMLIAHEFFDAMPINILERTQEGWREVMIDSDPTFAPSLPYGSTPSLPSGLRMSLSREPTPLSTALPMTSPRFSAVAPGGRIEVAHESWKIMRRVGEIIGSSSSAAAAADTEVGPSSKPGRSTGGGAGLVVDYGGDRFYGSSFRAFRNHQIVDPLANPGKADLTANVDFAYLRESLAGTGLASFGPISQNAFLLSLGLEARLKKLIGSVIMRRKDSVRKGAERLVDPNGMGSQYQVMGLVSPHIDGAEVYPFTKSQPAK